MNGYSLFFHAFFEGRKKKLKGGKINDGTNRRRLIHVEFFGEKEIFLQTLQEKIVIYCKEFFLYELKN